MYYCGGPYKEQAGTVPTYNTSIDCTLQSSTAQSLRKHEHKCAPKHRTKKLGRRAWPVPSRSPEEQEKLVAEHISKRPREMQDTCAVSGFAVLQGEVRRSHPHGPPDTYMNMIASRYEQDSEEAGCNLPRLWSRVSGRSNSPVLGTGI
jgi:hypothetical protein